MAAASRLGQPSPRIWPRRLRPARAPVVTSASYSFIARDNGSYLFIPTSTGSFVPGWYRIASTAGNAATLTATIGSAVLYGGATPTNTAAGCATVASPTGGNWAIDYSRGANPAITYTDMVIDATTNTKFTSAANPVGPHIVGNLIAMTSGTGFTTPQWVEVISVSGTTATCDKALGTTSSTGGHGGLGGALASRKAAALASGVASIIVYLVGGNTYSMTSSTNVAGGCISSMVNGFTVIGYTTSRYGYNTDGTRPICQSSNNSMTVMFPNNSSCSVHCIDSKAETLTPRSRPTTTGLTETTSSGTASSRASLRSG